MNDTTKPNGGNPTGRRKKKVSVFALARPSADVGAQISVNDVLELRPSWSHQQAAEFLSAHARTIGGAMVVRGAESFRRRTRSMGERTDWQTARSPPKRRTTGWGTRLSTGAHEVAHYR